MLWGASALRSLLVAALLLALPIAVHGQEANTSSGQPEAVQQGRPDGSDVIPGGVLTIDPERLFAETRYGQRLQDALEARAADLAAENRRIEAELTAEERDLTETRPTMPMDEFRALADAFGEKVDEIRAEQDAKSREVLRLSETGRQEFLSRIAPVLSQILLEHGGSALLDRRNVFLSLDLADVTDAAIERIDEVLGDGSAASPPE